MFHSPVELLHFTCGLFAFGFFFFVAGAGVDRLGVDRLDAILTGVTGGTVDILLEFDFEVCLHFVRTCKWSIVSLYTHRRVDKFESVQKIYGMFANPIHISKHSFLWCETYQLFFPCGPETYQILFFVCLQIHSNVKM